jgi:hypothetical protein
VSLVYQVKTIHYVECDGCMRRSCYGFHRTIALDRAAREGFVRQQIDGDSFWLCPRCSKKMVKPQNVKKAPLKVVR